MGDDAQRTGWHGFFYWSSDLSRAYELLVESLLFRDGLGHPRGLVIVGESRAGKSTFAARATVRLAVEYPQFANRLLSIQPPSSSREGISRLENNVLKAAKHPLAFTNAREPERAFAAEAMVTRAAGLLIDEAHLLYESKTTKFQEVSARYLRVMGNTTKTPLILLGTDVVRKYVALNLELSQRLRVTAELRRHDLDDAASAEDFAEMLSKLQEAAPVRFMPPLTEHQMMLRLFCTCEGSRGDLMDVVTRAVNRARRAGEDTVDVAAWQAAYVTEFPTRAAVFNPFDDVPIRAVIKAIASQRRARHAVASSAGKNTIRRRGDG